MSENDIINQILEWFSYQAKALVFRYYNGGQYDEKSQLWRVRRGPGYFRGTPDLIGIWRGRFLAIEVKKPGGKISPHQIAMIDLIRESGGIAFVAYGIDDCVKYLLKE